ncbi:Arginase/deacetylase [Dentipellis sp. KUC8613]|nr:Arginase/deacetylase [Dentipellis sp. KUC8613]
MEPGLAPTNSNPDPTPSNHPGITVTLIFLQEACTKHRFIRSRDTSTIVERPERLRAVAIGLSAAIARLEETYPNPSQGPINDNAQSSGLPSQAEDVERLASELGSMHIASSSSSGPGSGSATTFPLRVVRSTARVDLQRDAAVSHIHGDDYPGKLRALAVESTSKISNGESEIPPDLSQGDLYLCPGSIEAMEGAVGTVCEAVDTVINSALALNNDTASASTSSSRTALSPRAFVAVRPPGHHCGEESPSGFCFINNVAVGAAHAHLKHGIQRAVIFDIDLHHGNGTQAIAWQLNEEAYRLKLEDEYAVPDAPRPPTKPGLQIYYGSAHDILSYPCEDGKTELVQAASTSIHGPHGQHIENVHLAPYDSDAQFWDTIYGQTYGKLLRKAEEFVKRTEKDGEVLVFISCGFDACEHEYASMQRHARKVPTALYHRFARDARAFADRWARGRLVSVLEGGYSDAALLSGAFAHAVGLADDKPLSDARQEWWCKGNLEKLAKRSRKPKTSLSTPGSPPAPAWLERTTALLRTLDPAPPAASRRAFVPPSTRTLRARKRPSAGEQLAQTSVPEATRVKDLKLRESTSASTASTSASELSELEDSESEDSGGVRASSSAGAVNGSGAGAPAPVSTTAGPKKLPRVILKVRPPTAPSEGKK